MAHHTALAGAWSGLAAGLGLALSVWAHLKQRRLFFGISATWAILFLALLRTTLIESRVAVNDLRMFISPGPVAVEGVVSSSVQRKAEQQIFVVRVDSLWQTERVNSASGQTYVQLYDTSLTISFGDRLLLKGLLLLPPGERNPGDFNFRQYLAGRNIHTMLRITDAPPLRLAIHQGDFLEQRIFMPMRRSVQNFLFSNMSESRAAILYGLLIGDRSEMEEEVERDFRDVGVIHVLAVSGMHVGFIIAALFSLLKRLPLKPGQRTLLLLAGIWFYACLTGLQSPVARAALMTCLFLLAPLLQRRADPINTICIAALLLLIVQPLQLFMTGFQLSFAACLGMILLYQQYYPSLQSWYEQRNIHKLLRKVIDLFLISSSAQIATLPIVLYYFNNLPLVAVLANIPIIPFTGVIMGFGFLAMGVAAIWMELGVYLLHCNELLIMMLVRLVHLFSMAPWSHFTTPRPSGLLLAVIFSSIGLLAFWREIQVRKRFLVVIILLLNLYVWHKVLQDPNELRITFFDVGQGDAALFEFPDGRTLLVDAGDRTERFDYGERVIASYMRRMGLGRLDNVVITHPHADHLGGIISIINKFSVGRVVEPKIVYSDSLTHFVDSLLIVKKMTKKLVCSGDTLSGYGHASVFVLNPGIGDSMTTAADLNDRSVVLKLVYGRCSFLMTGDAGVAMENEWLKKGSLLRAQVVKVAHHGSSTASSWPFCRQTSPDLAVISVASRNRFHHPSPAIVARWQKAAGQVAATAERGAIVLACNGDTIKRIR